MFIIIMLALLGLCCSKQELLFLAVQASHCGGISCCRAQALGTQASVLAAGLITPSMWNLPGLGVKPMSPALAGRFLSTVPQGSSPEGFY